MALFQDPHTPFALFSAVMMAVMSLLGYMIRGVVRTQERINQTLSNHFVEDAKNLTVLGSHMAAQTEILRGVAAEVLHAALRSPDKSPLDKPDSGA